MINELKDLKALLKLCRSQGVTEIEIGTTKIKLGEMPIEQQTSSGEQPEIQSDNPWANFPSGILTPEQLMFYSSGGKPEDDMVAAAGDQ
jgi:hypothetical protein